MPCAAACRAPPPPRPPPQVLVDKTRNKFLPVAVKAATLFFVTTDMANIDPMYQWSLQWYIELFQRYSLRPGGRGASGASGLAGGPLACCLRSLRESEPVPDNRDQRIHNINEHFQYSLYKQICRCAGAGAL